MWSGLLGAAAPQQGSLRLPSDEVYHHDGGYSVELRVASAADGDTDRANDRAGSSLDAGQDGADLSDDV